MNLTLTHDKIPQLKAIISAMELLPVGSQVDIPQSFFASPALKTLVEQPIEEEEVEATAVSIGAMAPAQVRGYATVTGGAVVDLIKRRDIVSRIGCSEATWYNNWCKAMRGLSSTQVIEGEYWYSVDEVKDVLSRHGLKLLGTGDFYTRSSKMRQDYNIPKSIWTTLIIAKIRELPSFVRYANMDIFSNSEACELLKSMRYIK